MRIYCNKLEIRPAGVVRAVALGKGVPARYSADHPAPFFLKGAQQNLIVEAVDLAPHPRHVRRKLEPRWQLAGADKAQLGGQLLRRGIRLAAAQLVEGAFPGGLSRNSGIAPLISIASASSSAPCTLIWLASE